MSQTQTPSALASFDPFAVHPFTNSSGLAPAPPQPSMYPRPVPQQPKYTAVPYAPKAQTSVPMHAPRPQLASNPSPTGVRPIFVPFRPDASSPSLGDILLKKNNRSGLGQGDARAKC